MTEVVGEAWGLVSGIVVEGRGIFMGIWYAGGLGSGVWRLLLHSMFFAIREVV